MTIERFTCWLCRFGRAVRTWVSPPITREYSFCNRRRSRLSRGNIRFVCATLAGVPRITDERREARREQVLEAARACLEEHGLEAVSMEMIIARSGLSTGAVYGYFKGKDQIINAVVTEGTAAMAEDLAPILTNPEPPPLPEFVEQVLRAVVGFRPAKGRHRPPARLAPRLEPLPERSRAQGGHPCLLLRSAKPVRGRGEAVAGSRDVRRGHDPEALAELLTSITLGFVAQRALAGSADVTAHVAAVEALMRVIGRQEPFAGHQA